MNSLQQEITAILSKYIPGLGSSVRYEAKEDLLQLFEREMREVIGDQEDPKENYRGIYDGTETKILRNHLRQEQKERLKELFEG